MKQGEEREKRREEREREREREKREKHHHTHENASEKKQNNTQLHANRANQPFTMRSVFSMERSISSSVHTMSAPR
jgi:hypothetical protein